MSETVEKYEAMAGTWISDAAAAMLEIARERAVTVVSDFNDVELRVTADMTVQDIVGRYNQEVEAAAAVYRASPAHKKEQERRAKKKAEHRRAFDEMVAKAPAEMSVSDAAALEKWKKNNTDPYGAAIVRYAETWARFMEARMRDGVALKNCAEKMSRLADIEGITGFMYGAAVSVLASCWEHGEELRRWHNTKVQIGGEGDEANRTGGVLNPALLNLG